MYRLVWLNIAVILSVTGVVCSVDGNKEIKHDECLIKDLEPFDYIYCEDLPNRDIKSTVPSSSNCYVGSSNHLEKWTCIAGNWRKSYTDKKLEYALVRKKRYWWVPVVIAVIGAILFFSNLRYSRPRDTAPPKFSGCPSNIEKIADELKAYTNVSWILPTAFDQKDGDVVVHTHPRSPGSVFYEDVTRVDHYALDNSGNKAKPCFFNVTVKVIKCNQLRSPIGGYYQCFPPYHLRYGTKCDFGCIKGYQLTSRIKSITCNRDGRWSERQPMCERIKCDVLPPVLQPMHVSCTSNNQYGSICTYSCQKGYSIAQGMARVRMCRSTGAWSGLEPMCVDTEPPVLLSCIKTVTGYADVNSDATIMVWSKPSVSDNADIDIHVKHLSGPKPGDRLSVGTHKVIYGATDKAGNNANQCRTDLIIKQITCPKLYAKPYTNIKCPTGNRLGSTCEIQCEDGAILNGTSKISCIRVDGKLYGEWNWGESEPYCEVLKTCARDLVPPSNGALACDYWFGGKICQMLCQNGYDIKPGYKSYDLFVCSESGKWRPSEDVPNCFKNSGTNVLSTAMAVSYYFDGNCLDSAVRDEIKENFIKVLSNSYYRELCSVSAERCSVTNVQVVCGIKSRKRSVDNMEITFNIELEVSTDVNANLYSNLTNYQINTNNMLKQKVKAGDLDIVLDGHSSTKAAGIVTGTLNLVCLNNMVPSYATMSCVECPSGAHYNNATNECRLCEKGFYQDKSAQTVCNRCPHKTTTKERGATHISDCLAGCKPGYFSYNGILPCEPCEKGSYQSEYGSTTCNSCEGSKTTNVEGSVVSTDCKDFDIVFWRNETNSDNELKKQVMSAGSLSNFHITCWFLYDWKNETTELFRLVDENTTLSITVSDKISLHTSCVDDDINVDVADGKWHFISISATNTTLSMQFDGKFQTTYAQSCSVITEESKVIIADSTFTGSISQFNIWSTGKNTLFFQSMSCALNETGDVLSWKQFEDVDIMQSAYIHIPSECDDTNECLEHPCNNGTCIDGLKTFTCLCGIGYTGTLCDINIDDCVENACESNGKCVDGIANYTCMCNDGFKGVYCEVSEVDGGWSDWGEWTMCSVTCGNGSKSRSRLCDNPAPNNGGKDCVGVANETDTCSEIDCPSCIELIPPEHSNLTCTKRNETLNCTIKCDEGYEFDRDLLDFYTCGPETFFIWQFQTDDNPLARLPTCNPVETPSKMSITYQSRYNDLICKTGTEYEIGERVHDLAANTLSNLTCVMEEKCSVKNLDVTNCKGMNKTVSEDGNPTGIRAKFECDSMKYGSERCYIELVTAMKTLNSHAENGSLNIEFNGTEYEIESNSTFIRGELSCPPGTVDSLIVCVPCSRGSYYDGSSCSKCNYGSYQPERGKTDCFQCPFGYSTKGRASLSIDECIDVTPPEIVYCPTATNATLDGQAKSIVLNWTQPSAIDNSKEIPNILQVRGPLRGSEFSTNESQTLFIHYIAVDTTGNNSTCKFSFNVVVVPDSKTPEIESKIGFIAAIIGGSVGLIVLIALVLLAILCRNRRIIYRITHRHKKSTEEK